ncbi:MAG: autotransporter assembly complex family protein [Legionellales bacterium]
MNTASYTVNGISDPERANVEKRLSEMEQVRPLSEYSTEALNGEITSALEPFGYLKSQVSILKQSPLLIRVQKGPQLHLSALNIELVGEGAKNPNLLKLLQEFPLKVGDPLLTGIYNKAKLNWVNTAEHLGYMHSGFKKAEIVINLDQYKAQIHLIFDTGPLFYFGQVRFDPTYIHPKLLHRFVPFHPGQPYSTEQLVQFHNYLSGSGYFNSVLVTPERTDKQSLPIRVRLEPVAKYSYTLGAGYGTDTGPRGRAGLHVIPVNRWGHKFNAMAQGSSNQNVAQAQYIVPAKNPVTDQYSLTGNYSNLSYSTGSSNSVLLSLAEQHNLPSYQRILSINALYERFNYFLQPDSDQLLLYPKATLAFSKIKNKLFSPSGFTITLNGLAANKVILSDINVTQVSLDAKAALMIEPLKLRLYGHILQGTTQVKTINTLPLSLALLLGGTDNLKGYSFNSIGPGRKISYAGFELQKEAVKNWYLLGFYDAGAVYDPNPRYTQYDIGAGLMWVSPIGPIKAGLAQPIDARFARIGGSNPRLVVSMGPDL